MTAIKFDRVSKRYSGSHEALRNINLNIDSGEMLFLTGHSGAGKSTLLKLLMAMQRPSGGQLLVDGINIGKLPASQIPYHRRRIGVVFQNHQLLFDRSVFENVALPLRIEGYDQAELARRVRASLDKVGLLGKEKLNPIELSGGEQQRVGIARAVVNKPQLILADEPTGNLDPALSAEIMHLFEDFNRLGTTVLIASHDLDLIDRLGHRVVTLDHGSLVGGGYGAE